MADAPLTHVEIIGLWTDLHAFSAAIGASHNTAKGIRQRKRIPAKYWTKLVEEAERMKIKGVTLNALAAS